MAARKLQNEITLLLKKVDEGIEYFDEIIKKIYSVEQQSLKEKYELDLKKEIKKLQRHRDQIKIWTSSNDIKDKEILINKRKLIETRMEQFKECEKDTKMKTYSKEGLEKEKKKNSSIYDENYDDNMDEYDEKTEEIKSYLSKSMSQLNQIISNFIDKKESSSSASASSSSSSTVSASKNLKNKKNSTSNQLNLEDKYNALIEKQKYHIKMLTKIHKLVDLNKIPIDSVENIKDNLDYHIETHIDEDFDINSQDQEIDYDIYEDLNLDQYTEEVMAQPAAVSTSTTAVTGSSSPISTSPSVTSVPVVPPTPSTLPSSDVLNINDIGKPDEKERLKKSKKEIKDIKEEQTTVPPPIVPHPMSSTETTATVPSLPISSPSTLPHGQFSQVVSGKGVTPPASSNTVPVPAKSNTYNFYDSEDISNIMNDLNDATTNNARNIQAPTTQNLPFPYNFGNSGAPTAVTPSVAASAAVPAAPGVIPGVPPRSTLSNFDMFELSCRYLPEINNPKKTLNPSTSLFPKGFLPDIAPYDDKFALNVDSKYSLDTLFFIFYYQPNTIQQLLAAKKLKKKSWRFHKKYRTWFQRHSDPIANTNEYEEGTYVYFDFESGWCQRIKSEFKFDYVFLEDDITNN